MRAPLTPAAPPSHPHVDTRGPEPIVVGTPITVAYLWSCHQRGVPIALLVRRFPEAGPAKILDALSFAYDLEAARGCGPVEPRHGAPCPPAGATGGA